MAKSAGVAFAVLAAMLAAIGAMPGRAGAHESGRVELFITGVEVSPANGGVRVGARLVDRDSGTPAPGFRILARGTSRTGGSLDPVALDEAPEEPASYRATLPLTAGDWTLTLQSQQGDSSLPAISTSKRLDLEVDEAGNVTTRGGGGGSGPVVGVLAALTLTAAGGGVVVMRRRRLAPVMVLAAAGVLFAPFAGAQEATTTSFNPASRFGTEPVDIVVERRTDYPETDLPSPLYVPLRARLVDPGTGEPVPYAYVVRARVDVPGRDTEEKYDFAYPYGDTEGALPGHYNGIVIVPAGGSWRIVVNAFNVEDVEDNDLPRALGRGEITVTAEGPALRSTLGETDEDVVGSRDPKANLVNVALLFAHTGIAGAWYLLAGAVILVAIPARRRLLSVATSQMLDRNVGRLGSALLWATGILWLSGLVNLQRVVAFDPPLSGSQADRLWVLPYAKPYIFALYTKIGLYALMTAAAFALVREARRRAALFETDRAPAHPPARLRGTARSAVLTMAVGTPVIVFCVTLLKYLHITSEELLRFQ